MKKRIKLIIIISIFIIICVLFIYLYCDKKNFLNKSTIDNVCNYEKNEFETSNIEYGYEPDFVEEELLYKEENEENIIDDEDDYNEEDDEDVNPRNSNDVNPSETEENQNPINISDMHKAIKEVANSFYMRGPNIQYNSRKGLPSWYSPEEATSQNINHMVCSVFPRNTYYDLLGVKIPPYTASELNYAKENFGNAEVIAWAGIPKNFKNKGNSTFKEYQFTDENNFTLLLNNNGSIIEDTTPTIEEIIPYLQIRRCTYIYRS